MTATAPLSISVGAFLILGLWPFDFFAPNALERHTGSGLRFQPPSTAYTVFPTMSLSGLHEYAINMEIKPGPPKGLGTIFLAGENRWDYDFLIDQRDGKLMVHGDRGDTYLEARGGLREGEWHRVDISCNGDSLSCSVDCVPGAKVRTNKGHSLVGGQAVPLVFGSDANGGFCWQGEIRSFTLRSDSLAVLDYVFAFPSGNRIPNLVSAGPSDLTMPASFTPLHRVILRTPFQYFASHRIYVSDILANILLFMPIGYLAALILTGKQASLPLVLVATAMPAAILSCSVEVLQAFIPGRSSSVMDVLSNTMGALLGSIASRFPVRIFTVARGAGAVRVGAGADKGQVRSRVR